MRLNDPQAAKYALLVMYAEDMYDALPDNNRSILTPPIDPRIQADWTIVGFISAVDALADAQRIGKGTRFFYGFLARSNVDDTQYVAAIRGTENPSEWIEDVEFLPQPAPSNMTGTVENGFFSISATMQYAPIGGVGQPAVAGIAAAVGGNKLTVLGHSLGSALATYLTVDLAISTPLKNDLSACLFASPHTGDGPFAQFFDENVSTYKVYNYGRDVVPSLPLLLGYSALPKVSEFQPVDAQAKIRNTVPGNHHAVCYAAMLDYNAAEDWTNMPAIDQDCASCILGPNP
jgi:triacylglycerol lipase